MRQSVMRESIYVHRQRYPSYNAVGYHHAYHATCGSVRLARHACAHDLFFYVSITPGLARGM
jgi:hypothetical protein